MERELLHRLLSQAFLYDDPNAYRAGVQAAWGAIALLQEATASGRDPAPTDPALGHELAPALGHELAPERARATG